ncbi:class B sortase [Sporofaciens sp. SGI.106]|uniref:class B sortase n=1 Tax=Sporofaciens sp. SGI.106 TaxID=3420568 RepID=UPI003D00BEC7
MDERQKKRARKRRQKRKRKEERRQKKGGIISTIVLVVAIAVFCVSGFQLYKIMSGYHKGKAEYDKILEIAVEEKEPEEEGQEDSFRVNFDELLAINPDTVGWIRFSPEPSQINYPVVQGDDNDLYLHKTFSANDNTVGAIFVNVYNNPDFNDRNTIIYGHRMNDNSMFHDLAKYEDKSFWEANPYFYIYTPDGREITYHIYSTGVVKDTSDTYLTEFASDEDYQAFLNMTKEVAAYDTGIEVGTDDVIVTLSTCTKASNDDRFVVRGVKESERIIE